MCDRIAIIARGRIVAEGSMHQLRAQGASGDESLEDIFLRLTGARPPHALDAILDV
jgi:ABC-2 type transport system ATP-binding protein